MTRKKTSRVRSHILVIEMDRALIEKKRVINLNPDADPDAPCVHVTILSARTPDEAFPDDDFSTSGTRILVDHAIKVLPAYTLRASTRSALLRKQQRMVDELRAQGFWVTNGRPRKTHSVYVVELAEEVRTEPGVLRRHPTADPSLPCVYVGQTGKSPEKRLADHKRGRHASKWVKTWGINLMPELYERFNPLTELESLDMERALAASLRKKGYIVLGGH